MDPTVPSPESSLIDVPPQTPPQGNPVAPFPPASGVSQPVAPGGTSNIPNLPPLPPSPTPPPPPDMNNVTGTITPEGPKISGKLILWIVLGIILVLIIGGGAYLFASGKLSGLGKAPSPTPEAALQPMTISTPTPTQEVSTEGWSTFSKEGVGFTFIYPPDLEYREYEDGSYSVSKWGPTQEEGTEFYDGISLSFKTGDTGGATLEEWANSKYTELMEVFETTEPQTTTLAGTSGYKMHVKGIVEADYYYLPLGTSSYLEIIDASKDPTSAGFYATVQAILASLSLI